MREMYFLDFSWPCQCDGNTFLVQICKKTVITENGNHVDSKCQCRSLKKMNAVSLA